jgi:hypothetical protein
MSGTPRPVQVVDVVGCHGYRFGSVTAAAEWLGVSVSALQYKICMKRPVKERWIARYCVEFTPPLRRDERGRAVPWERRERREP